MALRRRIACFARASGMQRSVRDFGADPVAEPGSFPEVSQPFKKVSVIFEKIVIKRCGHDVAGLPP
ncbi:hypothetical protein GGD70_003214 [Paraburkholderia fungorum]|nr:hypothetical protein [Paraburkholderia fungorum]